MTAQLTAAQVGAARLASLLLDTRADASRDPLWVVRHFLAMQAQDAPGVAFSLGLRTGLGEAAVAEALQSREFVRSWPMRGTLHLVPSRDARWMQRLMGDRTLTAAAGRRATIGLPDEVAYRAVDLLGEFVAAAGQAVTRSECAAALTDAGITGEQNWTYHLLWFASALGHIAGGPPRGKEQTFVAFETWPPEHREPSTEEALGLVAAAYVRGHGPVTERELARWTGLGLRESRTGLAAAEAAGDIVRVETPAGVAWVTELALERVGAKAPTRLLPGFDEAILGYSEAERPVAAHHHAAIVPGGNGIFKPTVLDRGRVVGRWERKVLARAVKVTVTPFVDQNAAARERIATAAAEVGHYAGRPVTVEWAA